MAAAKSSKIIPEIELTEGVTNNEQEKKRSTIGG